MNLMASSHHPDKSNGLCCTVARDTILSKPKCSGRSTFSRLSKKKKKIDDRVAVPFTISHDSMNKSLFKKKKIVIFATLYIIQ